MADTRTAPDADESLSAGARETSEAAALADPADAAGEGGDTRLKKHVVQFCGGMGSLVGEKLDQLLRNHPDRARALRIGAVDTCLNDNRLFGRTRRSPWLRTFTLGQAVTNFDAVFRQHEREWKRDLPLPFLLSRYGIPGCDLDLSGVNKQPVVAAALNAMERDHVKRWLAATDASFDATDRSIASFGREVSYVAGTGGTGLVSAIMHAGWRSQMNPGLIQRLVVLGPELYPISGDPQRDRRHKLIMGSAARTLDRLALIGTDSEHPHFGEPLPGFSENLAGGFLSQVVLIEGKNNQDQTLSFSDAQRMVADYLYYLSQVPELASFLAVQLHEDMAKTVPAAIRTPFVWSSVALHVCELWRELPRIAALGKRAAVLKRMREGDRGSETASFASPITESGVWQTIEAWERRVMSVGADEFTAPIFDQIGLRSALLGAPAETGVAAVASIRSLPTVVDRHFPEAEVLRIAGTRIADLRQRMKDALPNMGAARLLKALIDARVSLGSPEEGVQKPVDHFLSAGQDAAISAGSGIVAAKGECAKAMAMRPGWFRAAFGISCPEIVKARADAVESMNSAVSAARTTISRIAEAVMGNVLAARMSKLRSLVCVELDAQIALLEAARDELAAEEQKVRAEIQGVLMEGRTEKAATRLSLFPDDAEIRGSSDADEALVASAFSAMFSWSEPGALVRTGCALEDISDARLPLSVAFGELFAKHPDAKRFIADHLRESHVFVRIREQGLQGLEGVTRRTVLVCPRSLAWFVETLALESDTHVFYADVDAVFVLKQVDTLPSSAIASLCEYDALLEAALASEARERNDANQKSGFRETLTTFPFGRYRSAPRTQDEETARWHRRASAALLMNPDMARFDSANPDTAWARLSLVTGQGVRVPVLGPDEPMHPECPLCQDEKGMWHIRFVNHLGNMDKRSLRTHVLAYALDLVSRHKRYQAAVVSWIELCAKACGLECGEAMNLAVEALVNWCAHAHDTIENDAASDAEAIRMRSLYEATEPTADMVCTQAQEFFGPDEWFLDYGVVYPNQVMHPARGVAAGAP